MTPDCAWRGPFTSTEVNLIHAEAFGTRIFNDVEWDWHTQVAAHSLGWVTARVEGRLVGYVNVIWDGLVHAWLQDTMVTADARHHGVGTRLVAAARQGAQKAGCEWLHVDFEEHLQAFHLDACGFRATTAGLIQL